MRYADYLKIFCYERTCVSLLPHFGIVIVSLTPSAFQTTRPWAKTTFSNSASSKMANSQNTPLITYYGLAQYSRLTTLVKRLILCDVSSTVTEPFGLGYSTKINAQSTSRKGMQPIGLTRVSVTPSWKCTWVLYSVEWPNQNN